MTLWGKRELAGVIKELGMANIIKESLGQGLGTGTNENPRANAGMGRRTISHWQSSLTRPHLNPVTDCSVLQAPRSDRKRTRSLQTSAPLQAARGGGAEQSWCAGSRDPMSLSMTRRTSCDTLSLLGRPSPGKRWRRTEGSDDD